MTVVDARAAFVTSVAVSARRVLDAHRSMVDAMTVLRGAADDHQRAVADAVEQLRVLIGRGAAPGVVIEPDVTGAWIVFFGDESVHVPIDRDLGRRLGWDAAEGPSPPDTRSGAWCGLERLAGLAARRNGEVEG